MPVTGTNGKKSRVNETLFVRLEDTVRHSGWYLDTAINREAVCTKMGICRQTLTKLLSLYTPASNFPDYISRMRVEHACKVIRTSPTLPMAEVAKVCGFCTMRNMQRVFKKYRDTTPVQYARSLRATACDRQMFRNYTIRV
ncbi:MAG: helix-turn-helix transcriptional regulator [Bacteroidaceae bacterium]|nr:helix-turn-helix transcriptional regulator [Bacteroidaceae bacterium]